MTDQLTRLGASPCPAGLSRRPGARGARLARHAGRCRPPSLGASCGHLEAQREQGRGGVWRGDVPRPSVGADAGDEIGG